MYKYDRELRVEYSAWAHAAGYCNETVPPRSDLNADVDLPSIKQLMKVASLAYKAGHSIRLSTQFKTLAIHGRFPLSDRSHFMPVSNGPDGFMLLATAWNNDWLNGYVGVAYINESSKQVIVGHRGTELNGTLAEWFGTLIVTDLFGVVRNECQPQVTSAMTFAHIVASLADKIGYSLFFTGHSLGAWLAQITCFSRMYLKVEFNNNEPSHFVPIEDDSTRFNLPIPYTVGFDSPGAYEFLQKMRNNLFRAQDPLAQGINVEQLPVEVFLFHENLVNSHKKAVGTVFLLKRNPKIEAITLGYNTHGIDYIHDLVMQSEERDLVDKRVKDFKLSWTEWWKADWKRTDENCGEPELNRFSKFFLNEREQIFTREAPKDYSYGLGKFEGIRSFDEQIANELIMPVNDSSELLWMLDESTLITCTQGNSRQKLIPRIRHVVKCLKEGRIWWNSMKITNATHTFERFFCRSVDRLLLNIPEDKSIHLRNFFQDRNWNDGLLLLTDYPGMGKSWALAELENILRSSVTESRIILRVKLKAIQDTLAKLQNEFSAGAHGNQQQNPQLISLNILLDNLGNLEFEKLKQSLSGLDTCPTINLYLLLDGVDEVYGKYSNTLSHIYHALQESNNQVGPRVNIVLELIVLSTRPQFKEDLEEEYEVKSCSLCPLDPSVTREFIREGILPQHEQDCNIVSNDTLQLLESPHLLLATKIILQNHRNLNTSNFMSQLLRSNCERFLEEKENYSRNESEFENKVFELVEDKLRYYYHYARVNLFDQDFVNLYSPDSGMTDLDKDSPTLRTLYSHGILTADINFGNPRFEPNRLAEFFLAKRLPEVNAEDENINNDAFTALKNFLVGLESNVCSCLEAA